MDQVSKLACVGAKGHAAGVDVGAGDVQLIGRDAFGLVEPFDDRDILGDLVAEDVDDDIRAGVAAERRQLAADEFLDAHVLQSIALSIPAAVCTMRGAAWPAIGWSEMPLVTNPPMRSSETMSSNSMP